MLERSRRPRSRARTPSRVATTCVALSASLLTLSSSGCALVKPSERALLAMPEMDPATDTLEHVFHSHVEAAREGAFGGHGTQGGGCGCG